ncbi:MAG TPA: D-alanyl-D-alanine carboxypeptidase family protein [Alphaproteobacteria bacterium]|nr:D-alanyl-D-alanine carboxypeptidase family protein [Alphaproteobacteria bacterium]
MGIKTFKFICLLLLTSFFLSAAVTGSADAARKKATGPNLKYASIVVDATTGVIVSERHADKRLYPASLTKMMTLYLTFEAIRDGRLRKNSRLTVSSLAEAQEPSKIGLKAGTSIRVEDAIYALVTKSANDVAVVLAEGIGGSQARFATQMNLRAKQLGMRSSNFVNPHGLHDARQYSTARDMATLSRALMRDFPHEYGYFKTNSFSYAGKTYGNHNKLLKTYEGMDGIKTGYIHASGYNLAASAVRDGRRLIGVVFGGRTSLSRNNHMAELLDAGFARLGEPQIARRIEQREVQTAGVSLPVRKPTTVAAVTAVDRALAARVAANDNDEPFDALGLVGIEQGDSETGNDAIYIRPSKTVNIIRGNTPETAAAPVRQTLGQAVWSIQVGAFSTRDAGLTALRDTRGQLPPALITNGQYVIAPLITSRGMIYRARLTGLSRDQATQACRILKENCLILAAQ